MNAALIDSVFADQDTDIYFYAALKDNRLISGGDVDQGDLMDLLLLVFDNVPATRPDLIEFANAILHSTDS